MVHGKTRLFVKALAGRPCELLVLAVFAGVGGTSAR